LFASLTGCIAIDKIKETVCVKISADSIVKKHCCQDYTIENRINLNCFTFCLLSKFTVNYVVQCSTRKVFYSVKNLIVVSRLCIT